MKGDARVVLEVLATLSEAFILGLLTPTTAACVLPLYPGFLAYLSNQLSGGEDKKILALFGIVITSGVILFMFFLGLIFTTVLQVSLTDIIGKVSPVAFAILLFISILLILNVDIGAYLPKAKTPSTRGGPWVKAFVFGFFFGAIVVPCNPAFIAVLFTRTLSTLGFLVNIFRFLMFGLGMGLPLLVFSALSTTRSTAVISYLTDHRRIINFIAGSIMLVISIYYLLFVFKILGG